MGNATETDLGQQRPFEIPSKLRQPSYFLTSTTTNDPELHIAINYLNVNINSTSKIKKIFMHKNLSSSEKIGLKWLQNKVHNREVAVCQADKGGSILLVHPDYLSAKVREKVLDADLYCPLPEDIRPKIYNELVDKWKTGKLKKYVTPIEAKNIVGITAENNKSTASRFKYGRTYYVPSLKIHKLSPEELIPGKTYLPD